MLETNVTIRRAAPGDAEALSRYMNALADENLPQLSGLRPTPEEEHNFLDKALRNPHAFILIALIGATIVGVLDLWPGDQAYNRHVGRLGMSVLAPYRGKGIGRRLLERAIGDAKSSPEFRRIELDVAPGNARAIRLYESVGFLSEGTMRQAAIFRGQMTDLIRMSLIW